jgi:hypothetical protein
LLRDWRKNIENCCDPLAELRRTGVDKSKSLCRLGFL